MVPQNLEDELAAEMNWHDGEYLMERERWTSSLPSHSTLMVATTEMERQTWKVDLFDYELLRDGLQIHEPSKIASLSLPPDSMWHFLSVLMRHLLLVLSHAYSSSQPWSILPVRVCSLMARYLPFYHRICAMQCLE